MCGVLLSSGAFGSCSSRKQGKALGRLEGGGLTTYVQITAVMMVVAFVVVVVVVVVIVLVIVMVVGPMVLSYVSVCVCVCVLVRGEYAHTRSY